MSAIASYFGSSDLETSQFPFALGTAALTGLTASSIFGEGTCSSILLPYAAFMGAMDPANRHTITDYASQASDAISNTFKNFSSKILESDFITGDKGGQHITEKASDLSSPFIEQGSEWAGWGIDEGSRWAQWGLEEGSKWMESGLGAISENPGTAVAIAAGTALTAYGLTKRAHRVEMEDLVQAHRAKEEETLEHQRQQIIEQIQSRNNQYVYIPHPYNRRGDYARHRARINASS